MKTTISGCKSRFSLTQNVFFNNLFFYKVFDYKCSWIQVLVLVLHLHPELVEGFRRMQHILWAASTSSAAEFKHPNILHYTCILSLSKDVEGCNIAYRVASTSSATKFKHPNALHHTRILSLSKDVKECNIAYGRFRRAQPPNLSDPSHFS